MCNISPNAEQRKKIEKKIVKVRQEKKIEKKTLHNLPFQDQRRVGCSQQRNFVYISRFPCKRISRSYVQKIQGNLDANENLKIALTASKSDGKSIYYKITSFWKKLGHFEKTFIVYPV